MVVFCYSQDQSEDMANGYAFGDGLSIDTDSVRSGPLFEEGRGSGGSDSRARQRGSSIASAGGSSYNRRTAEQSEGTALWWHGFSSSFLTFSMVSP